MQLTNQEQAALHAARMVAADLAARANLNGLPGVYAEAINLQRSVQFLVKEVEAAELELCEAPF